MKKLTFNLDLVISVIFLFLLSVGANVYQWQIHGELSKANISDKLDLTQKHVALINAESELKTCREELAGANGAG